MNAASRSRASLGALASAAVGALVLVTASSVRAPAAAAALAEERVPPTAEATDRCAGTPRGATELAYGCSAIELVRRPEAFVAPLVATLDEHAAMLAREPAFADAMRDLARARDGIERAGALLESGALCRSVDVSDRALERLAQAESELQEAIDARAAELAATRRARTDGDVQQQDLGLASWRLQHALVAATGSDAREARAAFAGVCAAIRGPLDVRGVVAANDDAAGTVQLGDGSVLGLAAARYATPAMPGTEIRASGVAFADGTGLVTKLKGTQRKARLGIVCLVLRVAPVQPLPPQHAGPYALHRPAAYAGGDGVLNLEQGMHLGAVETSCPGATSEGRALHYGMTIDVEQGASKQTIAIDLREGDAPVELPGFLALGSPATIETTVFRTECTIFSEEFSSCGPPEQLSTESYTASVLALGAYSAAGYSKSAFGVTDDGVAGDYETTTVSGVTRLTPAAGTIFQAEGYEVVGNVSSRPQTASIGLGDTFAVYSDDFYDPDILFAVDQVLATGQERPSALRWARVVGTKAGSQFWYSTKLPPIVHDRVSVCPEAAAVVVPQGDENETTGTPEYPTYPPQFDYTVMPVKDAFYELPFADGFGPISTGNLNIDDPEQDRRHPEWQAYALDLTASEGEELRAARGGEVVFVEESDQYNLAVPTPAGAIAAPMNWPGIGNYLFIRHEDATYGVYFHVELASVLPLVGDRVRRGQAIATVGQTGGASGPHVHFGVARNQTHNDPAFVHRVRYDALVNGAVDHCYIPRSTDSFSSTNASPVPD
jgi:murein DD-endopeptidase MepM/ murein hydrolase activator NlpD